MLNIQNETNKGVFTRSKEKIIEEGETPTKFFFLQELIKQGKKNILIKNTWKWSGGNHKRTQTNIKAN